MRPTFGLSQRLIEAYLLDFSDDIYDENLRLEFVSRLRGQETFDGIDALITQMNRDVDNARNILEEHDRLGWHRSQLGNRARGFFPARRDQSSGRIPEDLTTITRRGVSRIISEEEFTAMLQRGPAPAPEDGL